MYLFFSTYIAGSVCLVTLSGFEQTVYFFLVIKFIDNEEKMQLENVTFVNFSMTSIV